MPSDYAVPRRYRARLSAFVNRQPPRMQPVYHGAGLVADLFLLRIGGAVGAALAAIYLGLKSGVVGVLQFGAVFVLAVVGGQLVGRSTRCLRQP
ncbi:MAG: hypothetical protein ACYC2K_00695 [Gemmatimonadales bacterium]